MESLISLLPAHWPEELKKIVSLHGALGSIRPADSSPANTKTRVKSALAGIQSFRFADRPRESEVWERLVRALLLYAADALDECHQIFQEVDTFAGSYGHGMMHRREGDFWNANYWFRHAGRAPVGIFDSGFDPVQLTAECQKTFQAPLVAQEMAVRELRKEWVRVTDAVLSGRVG